MKEFKFTADCTFFAENIDDAFVRLSEHFKRLANEEENEAWFLGEMHIEPVKGDS